MSNSNNKQPPDLTKSLPISDNTQAPSTTTQTVKKPDYVGINLVEMSSVKPPEKNDSLGISGINQPNVTTGNLSHSDEASTSTDETKSEDTREQLRRLRKETIAILLDCAKRGENRGNQRPPSICKVSRILRDHNESSFEPQLVSIGPIHRENNRLKEFEWLKECYLNNLLSRCYSTPKETLEACLLKVNTLIPQIRESYAGMIKNYSDVNLARMMVMDGCFILEFCSKHEERNLYLLNKMQTTRIAMDLMLLENQIPYVVLQALFDCLAPYKGKWSATLSEVLDYCLARYIKLFRSQLREKIPTTDFDSDSTHDHVLGYLHRRYQLVVAESSNPIPAEASKHVEEERIENTAFHSIVELDLSGINFKPHQEDEWSMTIKFKSPLFPSLPWFWSKPTLLMPTLVIDDTTELILRNFIAYEQSFPQDRHRFTSYAVAMDRLIDTQEDIAKLVESKVLDNRLDSNQEAADMINKLCKNIYLTGFYYTQEFKQMDKYYNVFWVKNIARQRSDFAWVRHTYLNNSWKAIALYSAIIIFSLTVVQTIFTIKAA